MSRISKSAGEKSNFIRLVPEKSSTGLRLGGLAPSNEMNPGKYTVACENAWVECIGKGKRVVLQFRVTEGPHTGTALRQWLSISDAGGIVSPLGRYAKHCAIALDRPLNVDDDLNNPAAIFSGSILSVYVGYRKTEKPKGGPFSDKNALLCKGNSDYLRVHEILAREEL